MKIPKSFIVGPHYWRVHFVTEAEIIERAGGDEGTEGYTDFQRCEILLLKGDRAQSYIEHTFCHELMHVLAQTSGMGSKLGADEDKIDALGALLLQAFNTFSFK